MQLNSEATIVHSVIIERPVQTVFQFYRDFRNLQSFLGDVTNIDLTSPTTSRWTIQGPWGMQTHWTMQVVEERANEFIHYETINSIARRVSWKIYFSPGSNAGQMKICEEMKAPLGRLARWGACGTGQEPRKGSLSESQQVEAGPSK